MAKRSIAAIWLPKYRCHQPGAHSGNRSTSGPLLRVDRLRRERELTPLELAVNHFHPDRYSDRIQLRTRLEHATFPTACGSR